MIEGKTVGPVDGYPLRGGGVRTGGRNRQVRGDGQVRHRGDPATRAPVRRRVGTHLLQVQPTALDSGLLGEFANRRIVEVLAGIDETAGSAGRPLNGTSPRSIRSTLSWSSRTMKITRSTAMLNEHGSHVCPVLAVPVVPARCSPSLPTPCGLLWAFAVESRRLPFRRI